MTQTMTPHELDLIRRRFPGDAEAQSEAVRRLEAGEVLAYVLGEWYFMNEVYDCPPCVPVPRPETELLTEMLIKLLPTGGSFADLCTGSGCIAVSALVARGDCTAAAVEISPDSARVAKGNAVRNGVSDRLRVITGDILRSDPLGDGSYDIIVSNPPYIASAVIDTLSDQVKSEPRRAFDGGADGLDFYRRLITIVPAHLKGNTALFEIGYDQADSVSRIARDAGAGCEIFRDYSGNDRIAKVTF